MEDTTLPPPADWPGDEHETIAPPDLPADCTASYTRRDPGSPPPMPIEARAAGLISWQVSQAIEGDPASRTPSAATEGLAQGGYILRHMIGRGGMGEVWQAVQVALGRSVAVKRIRRDALNRARDEESRARRECEFRQEALINARLEHPNIVPVHDFGLDDDGVPLMAMKLVQGRPWSELVADEFDELPAADFLARHLGILASVGQAVAFAHSRQIVHRDLKPSQVMIGEFGEVLLMDWGLAVFVGEEQPEEIAGPSVPLKLASRDTASNPSGTPAMMAPEQTQPTASGIGTWTDIYLLGGILYQLLTGTAPHQARNAEAALVHAAQGVVVPPAQRAPDRQHPAELVELCMQALRKEPSERVASATEFVRRVEDYLSGAGRRRQSREIAAAANARFDDSEPDYAVLSEILDDCGNALRLWPGNEDAERLRGRALARYAEAALDSGDLRLARLQAQALPDGPERGALLHRVQTAEAAARRAARQRRFALRAAASLAAALVLGAGAFAFSIQRANQRLAAANTRIAEQRDSGERVMAFMLDNLSGKLQALGRIDLLGDVTSETLAYYDSLPEEGEAPEALLRRARAYRQLSRALRDQGDAAEAVSVGRRGIGLLEGLLRDNPGSAVLLKERIAQLHEQSRNQRVLGEAAEAIRLIEEALDTARRASTDGTLGEWVGDIAMLLNQLGDFHLSVGDAIAAGEAYRAALAEILEAIEREPGNRAIQLEMSRTHLNLGRIQEIRGRAEEALAEHILAAEATARLLEADPDNNEYLLAHTVNRNAQGDALMWTGRPAEALEVFREVRAIRDRMIEESPTDLFLRLQHARGLSKIAFAEYNLGNDEAAMDAAIEYFEAARALHLRDPANIDFLHEVATATTYMAGLSTALERHADALEFALAGIAYGRELAAWDPTNKAILLDLTTHFVNASRALEALGRADESVEYGLESLAIQRRLMEADPGSVEVVGSYAHAAAEIVRALGALGSREAIDQGIALAQESLEVVREAAASAPADVRLLSQEERILNSLRGLQRDSGDYLGMAESSRRSLEIVRAVISTEGENPGELRELAAHLVGLGIALVHLGEFEAARESILEGIAVAERVEQEFDGDSRALTHAAAGYQELAIIAWRFDGDSRAREEYRRREAEALRRVVAEGFANWATEARLAGSLREVAVVQPDAEERAALLDEAVHHARRSAELGIGRPSARLSLIQALSQRALDRADQGHEAQARADLDEALREHEAVLVPMIEDRWDGAVHRVRSAASLAAVAASIGDGDLARRLWAEVVDAAEAVEEAIGFGRHEEIVFSAIEALFALDRPEEARALAERLRAIGRGGDRLEALLESLDGGG